MRDFHELARRTKTKYVAMIISSEYTFCVFKIKKSKADVIYILLKVKLFIG